MNKYHPLRYISLFLDLIFFFQYFLLYSVKIDFNDEKAIFTSCHLAQFSSHCQQIKASLGNANE